MTTSQKAGVKVWIEAFRLRTLPLAVSVILTGSFLAIADGKGRFPVITLALLTTLFLQILSNLANDYGDGLKGTDNAQRVGPQRTVQSGRITPRQMKSAIVVFAMLSFVSGIGLLYVALGNRFAAVLIFLFLGVGAIAAAIRYTTGNHAYGYKGWGDLFVFVFFGLVAVLGTYYLNVLSFKWDVLLPASAMGLLSTGVLNLNNMRDMDNDLAFGKQTVAAKLGYSQAKIYHSLLVLIALGLVTIYVALNYRSPWNFLYVLTFPLFLRDLKKIFKIREKQQLDPYLKRLALSTLLFSILFGTGICL